MNENPSRCFCLSPPTKRAGWDSCFADQCSDLNKQVNQEKNLSGSILVVLLLLLFGACKDNGNPANGKPPCPPFEIVPRPAYDSPIWHPSGQFIGFNHT